MNWPFTALESAAVLAVAVISVAAASVLTVRRRRRLHRRLIEESVAAMAAQLASGPSPLIRRLRSAATILAFQPRLAGQGDAEIRPHVAGGPAKPGAKRPPGHRPADRIAAAVHELRAAAQRRGDTEPAPAVRRSAAGPVPSLHESPELPEAYEAMLTTITDRIRQANVILLMAASLQVADPDVRTGLAESLQDAEVARKAAEVLGDSGRLVPAVHRLAEIDIPVPDTGVPGEATRRDLERHAALLHRIAVTHEADLLGWLADAQARCATKQDGTAA